MKTKKQWTIGFSPVGTKDDSPWAVLCLQCYNPVTGISTIWFGDVCTECNNYPPKNLIKTRDFLNETIGL